MSLNIDINKEKMQLENVLKNAWGTIGPQYIRSSRAIADYLGLRHGITVFSASAALEVILRALNIGVGDEVIIASYSDPIDSMVTAMVGASPVFADVCTDTLTLTCESIGKHITKETKAVIADLPAGNACDAKALSEYCKSQDVCFIINMGDSFRTSFNGISIVKYADVAFADMSQDKAVNIGEGGAVLTDSDELFNLFFAYHNCGRPFGEGCTLLFDEIIGGDFRIAEWQASLIPGRLELVGIVSENRKRMAEEIEKMLEGCFRTIESADGGSSSYSGMLVRFIPDNEKGYTFEQAIDNLVKQGIHVSGYYRAMHNQPFLSSNYFMKLTGKKANFCDEDYKNSIEAQKYVVYIGLEDRA